MNRATINANAKITNLEIKCHMQQLGTALNSTLNSL